MITDIEAMITTTPATTGGDPLAFLDGINTSKPTASKRKTYPQFPPDDTSSDLVQRAIELSDAADQLKTVNALLGQHVTPFYFRNAAGRPDVESSVRVSCPTGSVLCTFKAQAKKMADNSAAASVAHILGAKMPDLFRHSFDLKIDGDEIPAALVAAVVTELRAVFAKHGCTKALKVEKQFIPTPTFYTGRHMLFTPEQNLEIHRAIPIIVAVKMKGVE